MDMTLAGLDGSKMKDDQPYPLQLVAAACAASNHHGSCRPQQILWSWCGLAQAAGIVHSPYKTMQQHLDEYVDPTEKSTKVNTLQFPLN